MSDQDWETVVFRKKAPAKKKLTNGELNQMRAAGQVESVKKYAAGGNKQSATVNQKRLDDEDDIVQLPTLRPEIRKRIVQARQAKGWTQKDLAQAINEKPQVVAAYESPTAKTITNHTILTKMERALGTKLRGD